MISRIKASLLVSAMSLVSLSPAYAQTAAEPDAENAAQAGEAGDSGDIIVTARRTNESLQKVPVAVTVVSAESLAQNNIVDTYGLFAQLPAVQSITRNVGNAGSAGLVRIRGVAPVAYYFNEAPLPAATSYLYANYFDLASVQVLKGPQGTLFGQASNAGAIVNTPAKPGESFGGYVKASAGNFDFKSVEGAIDIPLVSDKLFLRVAGIAYSRDAYIKDAYTGRPTDAATRYEVGRATLVWKPTSTIENTTMFQAEFVHDLNAGATGVPGDYNMLDNTLNRNLATLNGMTLAQLLAARDQVLANQELIGPYRSQGWSVGCPASGLSPATSSTVPGPNLATVVSQPCGPDFSGYFKSYGIYNTTKIELNDSLTVKNIFSHLWGHFQLGNYDNDQTRMIGNEQNPRNIAMRQELPTTWSNELQLLGKYGALDFVLGGFFYDEQVNPKDVAFGAFTTSVNQSASKTFTHVRSKAIYGQANYEVTPGLKLTAGLRQTWDDVYRFQQNYNATTLVPTTSIGGPGTPNGEGHWNALSYTLGAQYDISPDTMIYVTNSKGYSIGGLQNSAGREKFDPDTLNNLEFGLKTTIRSGDFRLRVNAAGYYGWWKNVKVGTIVVQPGTGSLVSATANAAEARIKGFELEVGGSIGDVFDLNAFVSYADPHYTRFDFINTLTSATVNLKDQPIQLTPKWKLGISPTIHLPVDRDRIGGISVGASFSYRTKMWVNPVKPIIPNNPANPDTGAICMVPRTAANGYGPLSADGKMAYKDCAPSLYNLNANINWTDVLGNKGLDLSLTITNLTKNSRPAGLNSQYDTLNAVGYQPNEPRMVYVSLGYKF